MNRNIQLVDTLEELNGPSKGILVVPVSLSWMPNEGYDLSSTVSRQIAYQEIIANATTKKELTTLLNKDLLGSIWPKLRLPQKTRITWELRFPALSQVSV